MLYTILYETRVTPLNAFYPSVPTVASFMNEPLVADIKSPKSMSFKKGPLAHYDFTEKKWRRSIRH